MCTYARDCFLVGGETLCVEFTPKVIKNTVQIVVTLCCTFSIWLESSYFDVELNTLQIFDVSPHLYLY